MWIWSQGLTVLTKAQGICIKDKTKIYADGYLVGKYSTEEKALKVLEDIKKSLEYPSNVAFYMPSDDEVGV